MKYFVIFLAALSQAACMTIDSCYDECQDIQDPEHRVACYKSCDNRLIESSVE